MSPPRLLVCAIALGFVVAAQSALAEMYKYAAYSALQTFARLEGRDDELGDLAKVA